MAYQRLFVAFLSMKEWQVQPFYSGGIIKGGF
jgi:hypothetical protein